MKSFLPPQDMQRASLLTPSAHKDFIGIDEAGRGCLAGPVVAAAVLLPAECCIEGLDDSKKLTAKRRELLVKEIFLHARVGIGIVWQGHIDRINILQATFHAMTKAVCSLLGRHDAEGILSPYLSIDGNKTVPPTVMQQYWKAERRPYPQQQCVVGGDGLVPAIGAASIVAKTQRDHIMTVLHRRYPQYNFAGHKGYGTKEHMAAIAQYGSCPLHRMTFAPLNSMAEYKGPRKESTMHSQGLLL